MTDFVLIKLDKYNLLQIFCFRLKSLYFIKNFAKCLHNFAKTFKNICLHIIGTSYRQNRNFDTKKLLFKTCSVTLNRITA